MKSILLNYSKSMQTSGISPYKYDYSRNLNVYCDRNNRVHPFVECPDEILCISTKTEAIRESDDSYNWNITLATKTFTEKEADD